MAGATGAKQPASQLLDICDRKIVVARPAWSKIYHRVRTPLIANPKTIGEHVHKKRKELGLQQWQLAKLLGVWRSTLGSWESNHYQPEGKARQRVIAWLGFDPAGQISSTQQLSRPSILVGHL
ncbi:MAG TPA: helix-turn-helix domain-containing protein [Opitutaceae bacterium]|nr:helix-turn-helix domain-containing protein [Opitutaceae bacterium]